MLADAIECVRLHAARCEEAMGNLSSSIRRVEVTEGFREVLDISRLDEVECAEYVIILAQT